MKLIDKTGQRFGRLTVASQADSSSRRVKWRCRCDCGNETVVTAEKLGKRTWSCGCLRTDMIRVRSLKHGHTVNYTHPREYRSWRHAKSRCYTETDPKYSDYGGRGITMAVEWRDDFARFYSDMGPCPKGHTIDRIDNDGDYAPGNCRWATAKQQGANKRSNVYVTYQGERIVLKELAGRTGANYGSLSSAVIRTGGDPVKIAIRLGHLRHGNRRSS